MVDVLKCTEANFMYTAAACGSGDMELLKQDKDWGPLLGGPRTPMKEEGHQAA